MSLSPDIRMKIQQEVVDPFVYRDTRDTAKASRWWRRVGNFCEGAGKVIVGVQGIVSFGAASFNMPVLGFVSGGLSMVAMSLFGFSSYAQSESKERTTQLNMLLKFKGLEPVPIIVMDSIDGEAKCSSHSPNSPVPMLELPPVRPSNVEPKFHE